MKFTYNPNKPNWLTIGIVVVFIILLTHSIYSFKFNDGGKAMKFIYDPKADAGYIKVSDKKIKRTKPLYPCWVNVDFDENDEIVGVEFLFKEGEK